MKHLFQWLVFRTLIGIEKLKPSQRKHAAATFCAMNIALIGVSGWTISTASSVLMALSLGSNVLVLAISCRIIALRIPSIQDG